MKSILSLLLLVSAFIGKAQTGKPQFASNKSKDLLNKVVEAHGGWQAWNNAKTLSFTHILNFGPPMGTQWGISEEVTEIKSLRTYQYWPADVATLANDGEKTWVQNWQGFSYPNMNVNQFYRTCSMPWSIFSMPYSVEDPVNDSLPNDTTALYKTITLRFLGITGESSARYYKLFIHPTNYQIKAIEYTVTYGAFLDRIGFPSEREFFGPVTHVYIDYTTVKGLILPKRYDTFSGDNWQRYGEHIVYNYSLDKPFDVSKMKMPDDAAIDNSSMERKVQ
jgi:hypothetical protein